jgi:hypothetical protein
MKTGIFFCLDHADIVGRADPAGGACVKSLYASRGWSKPSDMTTEQGSIVETRLAEVPLEGMPTTIWEHVRDAGEACEQ